MIKSDPKLKEPKGSKRSSTWPKWRKEWFKKHGQVCAVCGSTSKVELHHIVPFHEDKSKEEDEGNVIPLCEAKKDGLNCHLAFGHLGNFKSWNVDVRLDAAIMNKKIKTRPK